MGVRGKPQVREGLGGSEGSHRSGKVRWGVRGSHGSGKVTWE